MINVFICVQANVMWSALDLYYVTLLPVSGKQHYKYKIQFTTRISSVYFIYYTL